MCGWGVWLFLSSSVCSFFLLMNLQLENNKSHRVFFGFVFLFLNVIFIWTMLGCVSFAGSRDLHSTRL